MSPDARFVSDYLEHILEAIARASRYTEQAGSLEAFERDGLLQDATVRCIEIIGEAAGKIQKADPAFTAAHPEIPWAQMSAMRNRVIHGYFEVDYAIVWSTVRNDLSTLAGSVKAAKDALDHQSEGRDQQG
ncbi:MAG TPA: DUF86 domain-containing protein [Xanthomonadaceae bacterium]|jgi:uncharacterized protein with HEPN domain|nr:DUF86 domain-containing protein [Xanthomonadaceae bacterium]